MTRVLVVDDHPIFRDGLAAIIDARPETELAGAAEDAEAALALVAAGGVDLVLMDINLPGVSGVAASAELMALDEPPVVLVLTMVDDDDTVLAAMRAGARGYVLKGATADEILAAIRTVMAGGAVFGQGVASRILALASASPPATFRPAEPLTQREDEVLTLLARGLDNAQIARQLGLSTKTVQNNVSRILDKLQVRNRTEAALLRRGR